ncbi:MAG: hypothetical protein GF381_03345 [Candidatus Pacebacteria bacterium]|nr:hypothetical protein [Candidatus Paceibacterota bacterium]
MGLVETIRRARKDQPGFKEVVVDEKNSSSTAQDFVLKERSELKIKLA